MPRAGVKWWGIRRADPVRRCEQHHEDRPRENLRPGAGGDALDGIEEALQIANDSPYGLAAAVWTRDLSKTHLAAKALRASSVWINQYNGGDMTAPFGGFKQSGNGRDKSLHAFDKYTELMSTWIKL
ncbi:Aldehyde dehydrogenase family protein [Geopseudomonas sagittaria]|uniref:Aldehyde dehydrogenase family protein n=1 Tax=Geopseudomonas sagittaria TaxID=1135990 RepID=A0A1I5X6H6_9GAMM|nr:Aldehyde dehydrogenase family protein [Pseudomonas sagittaria]